MQGTILDMITGINNKYGEDLFKKNVKQKKPESEIKKEKLKTIIMEFKKNHELVLKIIKWLDKNEVSATEEEKDKILKKLTDLSKKASIQKNEISDLLKIEEINIEQIYEIEFEKKEEGDEWDF